MSDKRFEWSGKVVVVTGASGGIGAAFAREVSTRGAKVVLAARRAEALAEVARGLVGETLCVPTDVTVRAQVNALCEAAIARFGGIDVWVNNAGRGISRPLDALTDEDVDTMVRDNVKSALYGMQAVLPHFKSRGHGRLANVSSMLGRVPFFGPRAAYAASKAALNSFTESARMDVAKDFPGIVVTTVFPGPVSTDFGLNALGGGVDSRGIPGAEKPEDVARAMADGIAAGAADLYTRPEYVERALSHYRDLVRPRE